MTHRLHCKYTIALLLCAIAGQGDRLNTVSQKVTKWVNTDSTQERSTDSQATVHNLTLNIELVGTLHSPHVHCTS